MTETFEPGSGAEVRLDRAGPVATLIVDRPAQRNALSIGICEQMDQIVGRLAGDEQLRALVITGSGENSFVSGADIGELIDYTPADGYRHIEVGHRLFTRIERLPVPTIAAINGYCLGGGLELAMACDIRLASQNAKLGLPEINIAMLPGWGGAERLQRLIGQSRAAAMIITGEAITADEAVACGLVLRSQPSVAELRADAAALAVKLAGFAPLSMRATKQMLLYSAGLSPEQLVQRDAALLGWLCTTADAHEGLSAFLARRPAVYQGR